MKNDHQVRLLMSLTNEGVPLESAAARAGMSAPTARKYRDLGKFPSETRGQRTWRTRDDPFAEVREEIDELLSGDSGLEAKTIFEELGRRYPGRFRPGQLRTLQRRIREWRALKGPAKEVFFPQQWPPGEQGQSDFTDMRTLGITIGGQSFGHLLYHFVLPYSNWEYVDVAYSESFEALSQGLQRALRELGKVPSVHRTDNLSAATHRLRETRGRGFTQRYLELLHHYGLKPSKNRPGKANENGDVESSHRQLKRSIDQRLRLRGSRDFDSVEHYVEFLRQLVRKRNTHRAERVQKELVKMRSLPARALDCFREQTTTVSRWSTVRVAGKTYSVPSRLRGERLRARIYADIIELEYKGKVIERMERLRAKDAARIDYRHIIASLVRKPGAFERYVYREALFPSVVFRRAYDRLLEKSAGRADLEYLRILQLAATTMECRVESALAQLLAEDRVPDYGSTKDLVEPNDSAAAPRVTVAEPDLLLYDSLIGWSEEETEKEAS